jgi:hypothetical protein
MLMKIKDEDFEMVGILNIFHILKFFGHTCGFQSYPVKKILGNTSVYSVGFYIFDIGHENGTPDSSLLVKTPHSLLLLFTH